ncbi:MAG: hypothetical protein KF809_17380 [Chloroflexi bacterium]|nr:hypothetical protein [Chloroflexota bacterium]
MTRIALLVEVTGGLLVACAGFLLAPWLGLALLGIGLILAAQVIPTRRAAP